MMHCVGLQSEQAHVSQLEEENRRLHATVAQLIKVNNDLRQANAGLQVGMVCQETPVARLYVVSPIKAFSHQLQHLHIKQYKF